jgi:hypothetical protein
MNLARKLKLTLVPAALALGALAAPPAHAGLLVTSAQSCDAQQLSRPFSNFGDNASYTPVPGGSFEPGAPSWTFTGGARIVSGNESYSVRSAGDSKSLYLPSGATATSPSICVGLAEPTLRWFGKQTGGLLSTVTSAMTAEVLFEDSLGQVLALPIGAGALNAGWSPSLPAPVVANLLPLLPNSKTAVAFRFRAVTGSWNVDDVYVDPYRSW